MYNNTSFRWLATKLDAPHETVDQNIKHNIIPILDKNQQNRERNKRLTHTKIQ